MTSFVVIARLQDGSRFTRFIDAPSWGDAIDRMRASLQAEPAWCSARPINRAAASPHQASALHGPDWREADTVLLDDDEPAPSAPPFAEATIEPASRSLMLGVWLSMAALGAATSYGLYRLVRLAIDLLPAV